ncbi:MAG: hypothetical protein E7294_04585 [Lachnospiraceae bacterium]|jgi:hypothetical protein|nr:hypothetical protein [Lachnospiraceae bacterium]
MKQKKKNGFFTFICSFLPGAAEMYMGFMKMGVSLMMVFFMSFMIPSVLRASDVFIGMAFIVWFYGFFHARNIAASDDETFALLQDKYIWEGILEDRNVSVSNETARKWIAGILIVVGCGILWNNCYYLLERLMPNMLWDILEPVLNMVPQIAAALLIIAIGLKMIRGKKEVLYAEQK